MATLTTTASGLPYPDDGEYLKDVPDFIRVLAQALDRKVPMVFASASDRTTKVPNPVAPSIGWMTDSKTLVLFDGTAWRQVYPAVPRITSSSAAPTGTGSVGDIHIQF